MTHHVTHITFDLSPSQYNHSPLMINPSVTCHIGVLGVSWTLPFYRIDTFYEFNLGPCLVMYIFSSGGGGNYEYNNRTTKSNEIIYTRKREVKKRPKGGWGKENKDNRNEESNLW